MSAMELLEKVKLELVGLPADERERFFKGWLTLEEALLVPRKFAGERIQWPDIHERHRRIFGHSVLTENSILAAREEEEH